MHAFVLCILLIDFCPVHSLVIALALSPSFHALTAHEYPSMAIPVSVQTFRCIAVIGYDLIVEEDGGFRGVILDLGLFHHYLHHVNERVLLEFHCLQRSALRALNRCLCCVERGCCRASLASERRAR